MEHTVPFLTAQCHRESICLSRGTKILHEEVLAQGAVETCQQMSMVRTITMHRFSFIRRIKMKNERVFFCIQGRDFPSSHTSLRGLFLALLETLCQLRCRLFPLFSIRSIYKLTDSRQKIMRKTRERGLDVCQFERVKTYEFLSVTRRLDSFMKNGPDSQTFALTL